jgi:hypothetical protein
MGKSPDSIWSGIFREAIVDVRGNSSTQPLPCLYSLASLSGYLDFSLLSSFHDMYWVSRSVYVMEGRSE